jgi:hypothetical protein
MRFLGHFRLQDRIGNLLNIDLGYIQLLTGIKPFFLNKPYKKQDWLEAGWVTLIRVFSSSSTFGLSFA